MSAVEKKKNPKKPYFESWNLTHSCQQLLVVWSTLFHPPGLHPPPKKKDTQQHLYQKTRPCGVTLGPCSCRCCAFPSLTDSLNFHHSSVCPCHNQWGNDARMCEMRHRSSWRLIDQQSGKASFGRGETGTRLCHFSFCPAHPRVTTPHFQCTHRVVTAWATNRVTAEKLILQDKLFCFGGKKK